MRRLGGRFVLGREIGEGGMSNVFLASDEVLDRQVAVKVLKPGFEESDVGARFRREGRTAARLSHPNIVQVYDAGEDDLDGRRVSYIVMEYVPGGDLKQLIEKKGPLPEAELSSIGADIASGLAHAHERNVVHRDIKPQNVLMDDYGRPKLTDFGIARALDSTTAHSTRTGSYLGTALYSSPEQLQGEKVTPKSDVYSLGATLYEAATGRPPFSGSPISVASQQISKSPVALRSRGASISEALERAILACLAKDPDKRPEAADLRATLLQKGAVAAGAGGTSTAALAGVGRAVRRAGGSGIAGFETLVRRVGERFGQDGSNDSGIPTRTVIVPTRTFRSGQQRTTLLLGAVAALLLVLLVSWGAYAWLAPDDAGQAEAPARREAAPQSDASASASAGQEEQARKPQQEPEREKNREPAPSPAAAENAVYQMYVAAAYGRFEESYGYLSERYQEEVGSLEEWTQRYEPVSYVSFAQSPQATVSGGEARVRFEVQETRPGGTETVNGTWVVVSEGGEPRLDRLEEG